MHRWRILLIGNPSGLERRLRGGGYEVVVETDPAEGSKRLNSEWYHLSLVHVQQSDGEVDADSVALAMQANGTTPKIILISQALDETSQMVRQALTSLERPAPAIAVVSETEGLDKVVDLINTIIQGNVGVNRHLEVRPGNDIFYTLASHIMPEPELGQSVGELRDLFRILFRNCNHIRVKFRGILRGHQGNVATMWVQPTSVSIPAEYPLLVKCARKEIIQNIRERYETYLFRLTHLRLAGFAQTCHFAAIAYPARDDRPDTVYNFPEFYRRKAEDGKDGDIQSAIDRLFDYACMPWHRQIGAPQYIRDKDLRAFYLTRLGLDDKEYIVQLMQKVIDQASALGMVVEPRKEDLGFRIGIRGETSFYPNPIFHLYNVKQRGKAFGIGSSSCRIVHGNLRDMNFCLDEKGFIWLDGFESLEWGPAVSDVAGLEAILKFSCLDSHNPRELYRFERVLLSPIDFDDLLTGRKNEAAELQRLLALIARLRSQRAKRISTGDMQEYYANLFFYTMGELVPKETTSTNSSRSEVRKLHALLSAAMICYRLENWDRWDGWPGPKQVLPF